MELKTSATQKSISEKEDSAKLKGFSGKVQIAFLQ